MFVVGRIEVRCGGREFRGAGVDHFIDRVPVEDAGHAEARGTGQAAQGIVRVTEFLAFFVEFLGEAVLETVFELHEVQEFVEEPAVDLRDLEDLVDRDAGLQGLEDREHPEVVDSGEAFLDGSPVHRVAVQGVHVDLRAADRLQHRHLFRVFMWISAPRTAFSTAISKLVPMDMTSPVAFIWVPSLRSAFGNLSKGHFGNLTTM